MKGRKIAFVIFIALIGFLGFFATNLVRNRGKSDTELLDFSIKDTSTVTKVIITDVNKQSITLTRESGEWKGEDGMCVIKQPINTILETIANIRFKGYVPENARKNIVNLMMSSATKVEIFQRNKWVKTWYVGFATQDHYGTYMLLETPNEKSDLPVIMKVKNMDGIIEPRFFADKRKWKCTNIFNLTKEEIESVDVKHFDSPERSFSVKNNNGKYAVLLAGKKLKSFDTLMAIQYLNNFKKIHFELANFELDNKQIDSLKKSSPFAKIKVNKKDNVNEDLKLYRIPVKDKIVNDFGDSLAHDPDRFWCVLTNGEVVKCQYFVFNPLLMGHLYFGDVLKKE